MEMVATMVYQLMQKATPQQIQDAGLAGYYADHGKALYFADANGHPFSASYFQAKDDPIADLTEDMDAEQKARATYNHLLDFSDDPGATDALRFLREREIVHFQRFGEALTALQDEFKIKKVF